MSRRPASMDEVLSMTRDELNEVEDWCYQGDLSAKRFIKGMIRLLDNELAWQGREDSMSLRGLWYSGIKTALQNGFPSKWDDPSFDANRRYAQYLSEALSEMVKEGEVTYRSLNIVDDSRQREVANGTIEDDKILFVEKEAAYRRLLPIQRVFEISLVSGGGWEATALIEDLSHHLDPNQSYQLFVLSDYDPTGYRIAEDFEARAKTLGVNITRVERIGIEPDQVSDQVRRQERFTVPIENDYDERWLARNGIEQQFGLEIEAIGGIGEGGAPLRRIVVEAMRDHLRFRDRIKQDAEWGVRRTAYYAVYRLIDDITADLEDALLDHAVDAVDDVPGVDPEVRDYLPTGAADWEIVEAAVALDEYDGDHRLGTPLLDEEDYVENAVDAPTDGDGNVDVVTPPYHFARDRLKSDIQGAIEDGDIDLTDHINFETNDD